MSRIWTQCAPTFKFRSINRHVIRVVESQHQTSTRKLVDSDFEQSLLERELEQSKPKLHDNSIQGLHVLLLTPFRYPPLAFGSRFGSVLEPSLWYASFKIKTAFAEKAHYRWKFFEESKGNYDNVQVELTAFSVHIRSNRAADLTREPFKKFTTNLRNPTSYHDTQALGTKLRQHGTEVIQYFSARDPAMGLNVGLFHWKAFAAKKPTTTEQWTLLMSKKSREASFRKKDPLEPLTLAIQRNP